MQLAANFRSRPEILQAVARVFGEAWRQEETPFVPLERRARRSIRKPTPSLELLLTEGVYSARLCDAGGRRRWPRVCERLVEDRELRLTAQTDPRCGEPVAYRDIAVLFRALTDIQRYEEAFARRGLPCFVVGGGRGYYARPEIRDLRQCPDGAGHAAERRRLNGRVALAHGRRGYRYFISDCAEAQAGSHSDAEAANVPDKTVSGEKAARPQPLRFISQSDNC